MNYRVISANFEYLPFGEVYAVGQFKDGSFFEMSISGKVPFSDCLYIYDENPKNDTICNGEWSEKHCIDTIHDGDARADDRIFWRVLGVLLSRMKTDKDEKVKAFGTMVYNDFLPIYKELFSEKNEAEPFCESDWKEMRKICFFEHKTSKVLDHFISADGEEVDTKITLNVGGESVEWYMSPASWDVVEVFIANIKDDIRGEF